MVIRYLCSILQITVKFFPDLIKNIKDPEKPNTLEELNVVYEDGISVREM